MTRPAALLRLTALALAAFALSACISLLPKSKPVQLYRFGGTGTVAAAPAVPGGGKVGVLRASGTFQRESAGDRLLTVSGGKVSYIAQTRWAAPAAVLWDEAVLAAFDGDAGPARLVSRGEPAQTPYVLRLDVRNFEARYLAGPKAAPTIVVRVRGAITPAADRTQADERLFEASVRASDNRVTAIVAAYDRAIGQVLQQIVTWTDSRVSAAA